MLMEGHGGPNDEAEGRRLLGLAAAQGNAKAQTMLEKYADAAAAALLAEEEEAGKDSQRGKAKKKGKKKLGERSDAAAGPASQAAGPASQPGEAVEALRHAGCLPAVETIAQ
jgi:hypothetical protein